MMLRVVYLAAPTHGWSMLKQLCDMICCVNDGQPDRKAAIVLALYQDDKPDWSKIPDYDIGINFLGTHKVPAEHIKDKADRPKWLNFHPAPLPEYRGRNLAYHAIMDGAKKFGATLHYMDVEYDIGELIEVIRFPIEVGDTAGDLVRKSHEYLKTLFMSYIPVVLSKGTLHSYPQTGYGMYYKKTEIPEEIHLSFWEEMRVKALTVEGRFHPHCVVGGRKYKIVLDDNDK